jgi:hypothetical protein
MPTQQRVDCRCAASIGNVGQIDVGFAFELFQAKMLGGCGTNTRKCQRARFRARVIKQIGESVIR